MGDPKTIRAWIFYDWANSVYPLVINTAIFPMFYMAITSTPEFGGKVWFFKWQFSNSGLISYVMALSYLLVSVISPLFSGIADYAGNKKTFLRFFCYLGSFSCMALYFFDPHHLEISLIPVLLASIGFWGSIVFYNAYLPEIAEPKDHDRISAQGFSFGYFGSALLLIINLILIMGFDRSPKESFIMVGIWWLGFAQLTLNKLPGGKVKKNIDRSVFIKGFYELKKVAIYLNQDLRLKRYLMGFFVFSMGIQTVMIMATYFGVEEVAWKDKAEETSGLIISILVIQFIAIFGAYVHSKMSQKWGNLSALKLSLGLWVLICLLAWFVSLPIHFYGIAAMVGFTMGGVQALSRSTYSKFLPQTADHASFFSFYDVCEKVGLVIGTFTFGYIKELTGSMRNSILVIGVYFIVGLILIGMVPKERPKSVQSVV